MAEPFVKEIPPRSAWSRNAAAALTSGRDRQRNIDVYSALLDFCLHKRTPPPGHPKPDGEREILFCVSAKACSFRPWIDHCQKS